MKMISWPISLKECLLDHGKICNLPNTRLDELFFDFSTNFDDQIGNFCKVPVCNF